MKINIIILFIIAVLTGCSSSDKKSSEKTKQGVSVSPDSSAVEVIQDSLITKKFSGTADTTGLIQKTGQLNYTGNEPFAVPAIFVSGNETYKLMADERFMEETFKTLNGKQVSVYGKLKETGTTTALEVHFYKLRDH